MSIEGEITVTLHWDGQRVHHVGLASTRPLAAARVLLGLYSAAERTVADAFEGFAEVHGGRRS